MSQRKAIRAVLLASTFALMTPAAFAAKGASEGVPLAQLRPSPMPSPVQTPQPIEEEPIRRGTEPVEPSGLSGTADRSPFDLKLEAGYEFGSATSGGFAADAQGAPQQITNYTGGVNAWSALAEVGLGAFDLGATYISYMGVTDLSLENPAGGNPLAFYWPESAWSAYARMGALRLGYLNETFSRGIGSDGSIGSVILGLDGGFPIVPETLDIDWSLMGGWGVVGQGPGHIPAEAKLSLNLLLGPLNLSGGYVARATFTGAPGAFFTAITNPAALDTGDVATINATRLGTYTGPFLGARVEF